jgi:hypothetical protein
MDSAGSPALSWFKSYLASKWSSPAAFFSPPTELSFRATGN